MSKHTIFKLSVTLQAFPKSHWSVNKIMLSTISFEIYVRHFENMLSYDILNSHKTPKIF